MTLQSEILLSRFHTTIQNQTRVSACSKAFLKAIEPFKIATFACGEVDLAYRERTVFFAIEWPDRWREFYMRSGLRERDPVIGSLAHYETPFTWSELRADKKLMQVGIEALDRVAEHGWSDGLIVPIPRGGTRYGLVSLVAETPTIIKKDQKDVLALLSVCLHERLRYLVHADGFPMPPAGLTEREIQCLRLIAGGNSDREIAEQLSIAASTAHEYVENAKRKLVVGSRAEAVAVAVSLGIVAVGH